MTATVSTAIHMTGVEFTWSGDGAFTLAIDAFSLAKGERVLLVGPSGSGKSTFLSLLCGVVTPHKGSVDVLGHDLTQMSSAARDHFRAEHFGIIFQMFNLLPYASVRDNVLLPLHFARGRRARAAAQSSIEAEATRLLSAVGLEPALLDGPRASNLSVGQQQRVAAARALIGGPEIIVADEPTSALDRDRQIQFLDLLFAESRKAGSAVIMVSHDETLGSRFDRVVRLDSIVRQTGAGKTTTPQMDARQSRGAA
jgi:putative ABC transport system ATP-binding protein